MSSLNLVQYDSDEEEQTSKEINTTKESQVPQKDLKKEEPTKSKKEDSNQKDSSHEQNTKRVIKYASLQTSKNLLKKEDTNEEWKPEAFDFSKKNESNNTSSEPTFKSKKGNSYATSFLSNLPKPKKELKNVSKTVFISDSFVYEDDESEDKLTKKVKTQAYYREEDNIEHNEGLDPSRKKPAMNVQSFTEQDKQMVFSYDRTNKTNEISASKIIEVSANNLVDPNWEQNVEKRMASRLFDANIRFSQPDKVAKGKNQLASLVYDAVSNQDQYLSKTNVMKESKKKTSQKYGW